MDNVAFKFMPTLHLITGILQEAVARNLLTHSTVTTGCALKPQKLCLYSNFGAAHNKRLTHLNNRVRFDLLRCTMCFEVDAAAHFNAI